MKNEEEIEHKEIIYLDTVEMSSTLAQLDHGLMESIQRGNLSSSTNGKSSNKNGTMGMNAGLKAELAANHSSSESRTDSEQKFVNIIFNDYQLDMLIKDLNSKKMLADVSESEEGDFVAIQSNFNFFDFNSLAVLDPNLYASFMKTTNQSSKSVNETKYAFKKIQVFGKLFATLMPDTYLIRTKNSLSVLERKNFRMNQGQAQMLSGSSREVTVLGIVQSTALSESRSMDDFSNGDLSKIGGIMPSFTDTMLQSIGILNSGDRLIKPIAAYF